MLTTACVSVMTISLAIGIVTWLKKRRIGKLVDKIPGPKAVALFGNVLQFPSDPKEFFQYMENLCFTYRDSGMYRLWFGPRPAIVIYRADLLEILFNSSKHIKKSFFYKLLEPWIKTGLLTSTGEKWHARRKMITPTFHFKILEEFLDIMNEQVQIMLEILDSKVGEEAFDVQTVITNCTLDIICDTAMGCHVNAQRKESDYVEAIHRMSGLFFMRMKAPWLWSNFIFGMHPVGRDTYKTIDVLHKFTRKVIKERSEKFDRQWEQRNKELGKENPGLGKTEGSENLFLEKPIRIGKRMAFLDMLLHAAKTNSSLTQDDIQEEVDTFMFEGHDTTAATTVWALYFIGKYPEVQAKLHQEVDRVFGDMERPVTMEDLGQLKYLECVFKESMRLYTTVPAFGRECCDDTEIGGYFVPKGTAVFIMCKPVHRDPKYFPDPEKFDPDRWLTDNSTDKHPFSYIPFSAGLRNCVGQKFAVMEEKVLLGRILHRFNITCTDPDDIEGVGLLILRPADGLHIKLSKR